MDVYGAYSGTRFSMNISNVDNNNIQDQQIDAKSTKTRYAARITIIKLVVGQGSHIYFALSRLFVYRYMYKKGNFTEETLILLFRCGDPDTL